MSIYAKVKTEFRDLETLVAAIEAAGLGAQVKVYPEQNGVYRKWQGPKNKTRHDNRDGDIRGTNASLVIHGGLDTWSPPAGLSNFERETMRCPSTDGLRGGPGWYCGDTAFVYDPETKTYVAEIDEAHGNASLNWSLVKDNYAAIMVQKVAAARGLRCERETNAQGKIVLRVYPGGQAAKTVARPVMARG